jgi:probable HAF family extracellular repeat protein
MTDLGTFSATAMSEATAVNRGRDVVGGSGSHALLVHNGTMTDLGLGEATGINDVGQIVASGSNAQGQEHAFLLTQLVSAPRIYRPPA